MRSRRNRSPDARPSLVRRPIRIAGAIAVLGTVVAVSAGCPTEPELEEDPDVLGSCMFEGSLVVANVTQQQCLGDRCTEEGCYWLQNP